jgi:hypothetical protein
VAIVYLARPGTLGLVEAVLFVFLMLRALVGYKRIGAPTFKDLAGSLQTSLRKK